MPAPYGLSKKNQLTINRINAIRQKSGYLKTQQVGLHAQVRNAKVQGAQDLIPIGPKPPSPNLAWWFLSRQAKDKLDRLREAGMFGGIAGQAPYWIPQEVGNAGAAIMPLGYIKKSVDEWQAQVGASVKKWILT